MQQARILNSFSLPAPRPYAAAFSVRPAKHGFDLWEDGHQIGYFNTSGWFFLDLWSFSPHEPPVYANRHMNPQVRDIHSCRNTNLNLPFTSGRGLVEGVDDPFARMQLEWLSDSGSELRWRISGEFLRGQRIVYDWRIAYDPSWGRFRVWLDADAWTLRPEGFEPINLMVINALHSKPEKRRWTHSIWEDTAGQVRSLVHSNALFMATDYGRDSDGAWRSKNAPTTGAWIAYATHPDFNPAIVIHEANVPMRFATCSQLFDEHLLWQQAGLENLQENHFHFSMHTELVNLDADVAQSLLDSAIEAPKPKQWLWERVALPFRLGVVNSLEAPVDVWAAEECPILIVSADPAEPIAWVTDHARSGQKCVRLRGDSANGWTTLYPTGAVCNVEPGKQYTFSAWVRTSGVECFARLCLDTARYTFTNVIDHAVSDTLSGDSAWTFISVALKNENEAFMMPRLELYGSGEAFFDDLIFAEESNGSGRLEETL